MVPPKGGSGEHSHRGLQGETASAGSSAEKGHAQSYQASQVHHIDLFLPACCSCPKCNLRGLKCCDRSWLLWEELGAPTIVLERHHHLCLMFRVTSGSSRWMLFHLLEGAPHPGQRAATGCGTPPRCPHLGRSLRPSTNLLWARRPPKRSGPSDSQISIHVMLVSTLHLNLRPTVKPQFLADKVHHAEEKAFARGSRLWHPSGSMIMHLSAADTGGGSVQPLHAHCA